MKNYNWYVKCIYSFPYQVVVNMVSPPFKNGGNPNFENFKKGETWKKFGGGGNQKGEDFQK